MQFVTRARLVTVGTAALGAAVFLALGMPLPLLLGPMFGCLIAALGGARLQDVGVLGTLMRTFLGVAIGATITPALIADLPGYGPTLLAIPLFVLAIGAVGYPLFRRVCGYDRVTAYYAAMPGGLQDMLIFGEEAGGNVRAMSLIHATRVLLIVTLAPFLLTLWFGLDLTAPPGAPALDTPPAQLLWMLAAAIVGWRVATRAGLFGASILGPMIAAAALSLSGVLTMRPPAEVIWAAQFFIGLSIGAKYTGLTARELRRDVGAGVLFSAVLAAISLGFIRAVHRISGASTLDTILAFLPGGQAEMVVVALVAGADIAFVVAHHLVRIIVVILLAPLFLRLLR